MDGCPEDTRFAWLWKFVRLFDKRPNFAADSSFFTAMHKAWPELFKKMQANKVSTTPKERQLVISARTWFCLYIFEHQ